MAGETTTGSLADSLPLIIDSARIRREYPQVAWKLCEQHKLDANTGLSWEEVEFARLTAQRITETTRLQNYQQYADTMARYTPTMSGLATLVTDKVYARLSKVCLAQMGSLAQDAMERLKDQDVITAIDGFTNSTPGTGSTLSSSHVTAAFANERGNTTEGATGAAFLLLHGFQLKDVQDELVSGVGTYPLPAGITADVWRQGFAGGMLDGAEIYIDNNIPLSTTPDAKGGAFYRMALLAVQGEAKKTKTVRDEEYGGGAEKMFHYDEYVVGERTPNSVSVLGWEIMSDATAPA